MELEPAVAAARAQVPREQSAEDMIEHRRLADAYQDQLWPLVGLDGPELSTREVMISTPGRPDARLQLLYPPGAEPGGEPLPACLTLFGGGWRQGGLHHPSHRHPAARRAAGAGVIMASLSYALAPEHPYPAALDQCVAALDWLVDHGPELGVDPGRIGLDGTSAGGNLAAALALRNRDGAGHPLRLQILEVAALDLTGGHFDWTCVGPDVREPVQSELLGIVRQYVPTGRVTDPYVSPLLAGDLSGLPPAYILTSELDPLRGDGEAYASALSRAGVPVAAFRVIGADHGSQVFEKVSLGARAAQSMINSALRTLHD
ncbi:alpha/beta hydrolase fold domain-containing protein [Microlunatus parietis]|uniref:Acetyl esterase n=1 Tax=Microlunatus parietis TaxID=682979 RepID=A0A7Y9IBB1_9ACTN|nr:alpha/beta hydrolase [Microlunatus parietis]NYE73773.1 acetyl esterase [Microlunatus parietis]